VRLSERFTAHAWDHVDFRHRHRFFVVKMLELKLKARILSLHRAQKDDGEQRNKEDAPTWKCKPDPEKTPQNSSPPKCSRCCSTL